MVPPAPGRGGVNPLTPERIEQAVEAALTVRTRAYAPFSGFQVGAAVIAASGRIYTGVNVENSSYGLTICAERSAVFRMVAEGDQHALLVVVATDTPEPVMPCGACRQVLYEFGGPELRVVAVTVQGKRREVRLGDLLPDGFRLDPSTGQPQG